MYFLQYFYLNKYIDKPYGCMYFVRALISDKNVARLEKATNTKITKNCDQALGKALDDLEMLRDEKEEKDSFDMTVCDDTKKEMK